MPTPTIPTPKTTVRQYGVRYGDGETEFAGYSTEEVEAFVSSLRHQIAAGEVEADDYEPMAVVSRRVTTFAPIVSEWREVSP